jgi:hypothetical protein
LAGDDESPGRVVLRDRGESNVDKKDLYKIVDDTVALVKAANGDSTPDSIARSLVGMAYLKSQAKVVAASKKLGEALDAAAE